MYETVRICCPATTNCWSEQEISKVASPILRLLASHRTSMYPARKIRSYPTDDHVDEEMFVDSTSISITTDSKHEELVGIRTKSSTIIDWFPVASIMLSVFICLIALIILCRFHIKNHSRLSKTTERRNNRNKNNNQTSSETSLLAIDVAECIDGDIEFVSGLHILLARGTLVLNNENARMLNAMTTSDRLRYFQKASHHVK